eukprot:gene3945-6408_t
MSVPLTPDNSVQNESPCSEQFPESLRPTTRHPAFWRLNRAQSLRILYLWHRFLCNALPPISDTWLIENTGICDLHHFKQTHTKIMLVHSLGVNNSAETFILITRCYAQPRFAYEVPQKHCTVLSQWSTRTNDLLKGYCDFVSSIGTTSARSAYLCFVFHQLGIIREDARQCSSAMQWNPWQVFWCTSANGVALAYTTTMKSDTVDTSQRIPSDPIKEPPTKSATLVDIDTKRYKKNWILCLGAHKFMLPTPFSVELFNVDKEQKRLEHRALTFGSRELYATNSRQSLFLPEEIVPSTAQHTHNTHSKFKSRLKGGRTRRQQLVKLQVAVTFLPRYLFFRFNLHVDSTTNSQSCAILQEVIRERPDRLHIWPKLLGIMMHLHHAHMQNASTQPTHSRDLSCTSVLSWRTLIEHLQGTQYWKENQVDNLLFEPLDIALSLIKDTGRSQFYNITQKVRGEKMAGILIPLLKTAVTLSYFDTGSARVLKDILVDAISVARGLEVWPYIQESAQYMESLLANLQASLSNAYYGTGLHKSNTSPPTTTSISLHDALIKTTTNYIGRSDVMNSSLLQAIRQFESLSTAQVSTLLRLAVLTDASFLLTIIDVVAKHKADPGRHVAARRLPSQQRVSLLVATALRMAQGMSFYERKKQAHRISDVLGHICTVVFSILKCCPPALTHIVGPKFLERLSLCRASEAWFQMDTESVGIVASEIGIFIRKIEKAKLSGKI